MKNIVCLIIGLFICTFAFSGNITTTYDKGAFHTTKTAVINGDYTTCSRVTDRFILEFQTTPANLFTWAFKGLGQTHQGDGTDDVVLVMNSFRYNPDSAKSVVNVDFRMSNGLTIRDKDLMSYVHDNTYGDSLRIIIVDFYYSGSLLKKADGVFTLKRLNDKQTEITIDTNIRFGWFFNIFITQRRYRNVMEWRIDKFIDNLQEEAESNWKLSE